jgi:hypothetical protein
LLTNTSEYAPIANSITQTNPSSTAMMVASTALITEKTPFIPHAQGTILFSADEINFNPVGKGIPIKNAGGAIQINDKIIFAVKLKPIVVLSQPERNKA